jgi:hypothetical protein
MDANQVYVTIRPSTDGAAAFYSSDEGNASWDAISDALQQADPTVSSTAIAVNPAIIYLATDDGRCFTSSARGAAGSWSAAATLGGVVTIVLIDPNTAAVPATTVLYAAGSDGVWQLTNGGALHASADRRRAGLRGRLRHPRGQPDCCVVPAATQSKAT